MNEHEQKHIKIASTTTGHCSYITNVCHFCFSILFQRILSKEGKGSILYEGILNSLTSIERPEKIHIHNNKTFMNLEDTIQCSICNGLAYRNKKTS